MLDGRQGIVGSRTRLPRILRISLAAAAIAAAISGCGDLSLVDSLQQEAPGQLRFSPSDLVLPLATPFTFTVTGGIPPYGLVSGEVTSLGGDLWEFKPQASIGSYPIQVSDWAGKTAESIVQVYGAGTPKLNVTDVTLPEGAGWTFTVTGGSPAYSWELDGVSQPPGPSPNASYYFVSSVQNTYVVVVIDSLGVSEVATVTVVPNPGGAPLSITPVSAVTVPGGMIAFTALGGSGPYTFSVSPGQGAIVNGNPATYTAPSTAGGPYSVNLTDGKKSVSAAVTVTASGGLLELSPNSVTVSLVGSEVQFTATGGTTPYAFTSNRPKIGSIDALTGLYRQEAAGSVLVTLTDLVGLTDKTLVKWTQ